MIYGTIGVIALLLGGIISGFLVSRDGFKKWILPMALAINLPDLLYVWMAAATPDNPLFISICVAIAYRIHEFLYLGMYMYDSRYHSVINDPQSTGRFIRKKNIEQNYL